MLRRSPPLFRAGAETAARHVMRQAPIVQPELFAHETPVSLPMAAYLGARLDRPLYVLLSAGGAFCAGRVWQGDCLLLFTSQAAAVAFADVAGVEPGPARVFSRSRTEFLSQAGWSSEQGFIGAMLDPIAGAREAAFVGFRVDRRQAGMPATSAQ